jgi:hypothetical protein
MPQMYRQRLLGILWSVEVDRSQVLSSTSKKSGAVTKSSYLWSPCSRSTLLLQDRGGVVTKSN